MSKNTAIAEFLEAFFKRFPKSKLPVDSGDTAKIIKELTPGVPAPTAFKHVIDASAKISKEVVTEGLSKNTTFWQSPVIKWVTNAELARGAAIITCAGTAVSLIKPKYTLYDILYNKEAGIEELQILFAKIVKFSLEDHSSKHYNPKYVKLEFERLMNEYLAKVDEYQNSCLFINIYNFPGSSVISGRKAHFYYILSHNQKTLEELNLTEDDKHMFNTFLEEKKFILDSPDIYETIMNSKQESCISKTPMFFIEA
jgi:hypothetical protein